MANKRKKKVDCDEWQPPKKTSKPSAVTKDGICIIHASNCSSTQFTKLTNNSLQKLLSVKNDRQRQPIGSIHRMDLQCDLLDTHSSQPLSGKRYHRDCYLNFTRNFKRLSDESASSNNNENGDNNDKRLTR